MTLERVADAVAALAPRVAEPDVRAQLHALAGVLRNLAAGGTDADPAPLEAALAAGDEAAVLAELRELAAANRAAVWPVDWSAASGG